MLQCNNNLLSRDRVPPGASETIIMIKRTTPFEIPNEMRAVAETKR